MIQTVLRWGLSGMVGVAAALLLVQVTGDPFSVIENIMLVTIIVVGAFLVGLLK